MSKQLGDREVSPLDSAQERTAAAPKPAHGGDSTENGGDEFAPTLAPKAESGDALPGRSPSSSPSASASGEVLPLQTWERYQIVSFLGAGGMGAVYRARDPRLNRSVAIKFLRGGQADSYDPRQRRHFEREARAQAGIEHPHICKIYEVGEVEGQPYIVMQLIHGSSLSGVQQAMSREEKVRAVQKVCEALQAAHSKNMIHRDIKPGNIMVERRPDGTWWPYLMDFGLVKEVNASSQSASHSSTGGVEGTPAYMAPEQARGEKRALDPRADVYGLGATLYTVLAGRTPFVGNSTDVLLEVLLNDPPRLRTFDPAIPAALETIVHKCMDKNPKHRYESAAALAEDLGRFLEGTKIAARPPSIARRMVRFAQRNKLFVASAATALVAGLVLGVVTLRIRFQAAEQARLAQRLGQEITKMEWLLRSARQLPLHDLGREKRIIRKRMELLQTEVATYGQVGRGLAHYALGRGHMALHEYPQALDELRQAVALGVQSAEVDYALGFVLGKHFEKEMYEARLSGGGDWAKKQLKAIEPNYLQPALVSLQRSRAMKLDAPQYLEGLIAYYQRDYATALKQADAALREAPWLYEAAKLAGDVHLEQALQARDSGHAELAERDFASAVQRFEAAAAIGQSDGEVYEGLAEAWVRQIEMARDRGQPFAEHYTRAIAATNKLMETEPESIAGPLKKAFAAGMTTAPGTNYITTSEPARLCLESAERVLEKQPGNPYASDMAAMCLLALADIERLQGVDPEPRLRKALGLLEPVVKKFPHFLWGLNDLGNLEQALGTHLQLHGSPAANAAFQRGIDYATAAAELDPSYIGAPSVVLWSLVLGTMELRSEEELKQLLAKADAWMVRCQSINAQYQQCFNNIFQIYTRAAYRALQAGQDPQPRLQRGLGNLATMRKLGGPLLDAEQHAVFAALIDAMDRVRRKQDPAPALAELQANLQRCFASAAQDVMCRTLAAQADWVRADWEAVQGRAVGAMLDSALSKATLAAQTPETYPDAQQTLAATHLRLAQVAQNEPKMRELHIAQGLEALTKTFAINANHAQGLATQGALLLLRAQTASDPSARSAAGRAAKQALERALEREPFLTHAHAALLKSAQAF